jgi:cell division protease FtsH
MIFLLFVPLLTNAFILPRLFSKHTSLPIFSIPIKEPNTINNNKYPLSRNHYESYIKRLNSKNITYQLNELLNNIDDKDDDTDEDTDDGTIYSLLNIPRNEEELGFRVVLNKEMFEKISKNIIDETSKGFDEDEEPENEYKYKKEENKESNLDNKNEYYDIHGNRIRSFGRTSNKKAVKSENFELIKSSPINFTDIGGYENIKRELYQCIDILSNYTKYKDFNVRLPKGLIFEGPPGNGKTLLAKALAGEAGIGFIPVSGSEFQDKYIGVGSARVRELFKLAKENTPCIVFIDEIDAIGRRRSSEGESSGNERDSTLNQLLIELDGFKDLNGVFLVGATNRIDLLDTALIRPGRIDKRIYIGNPDTITRKAIIDIHSKGKPFDNTVVLEDLVEVTSGLSGSQIENLLNEGMLSSLRNNRYVMNNQDLDEVLNKMLVGWQPTDHQFSNNMIEQISIHEIGHAVVGLLSKHHSKMKKAIINLSSPNSPAYTVFENNNSNFFTREALFEHLMILLAGRVAEEAFYDISVTTGAINDFEEALKLAEKMICYYGMGKKLIYPNMSEKYKEIIDTEVAALINDAYGYTKFIIRNSKELIKEGAEILKRDKVLNSEILIELMNSKHRNVLDLLIGINEITIL